MVNLTMVVADGAGRWDTTTHGYRHDPRSYTFPHARSLARSPLLDSVSRSYLLSQRDSVPRIFWERLVFGVFLFFPQRRMDSTVQAFSSHPPNFYFFSISRI